MSRMMTQLTEDTFEQLVLTFRESMTIDIREVTFIDPYGMVGLLEIGELRLKPNTQHRWHETGCPETGCPETGCPETGCPETGCPETGCPETGCPETGCPETGCPETGCQALAWGTEDLKSTILLPLSEEVIKYLERMDFFRFAGEYFRLEPSFKFSGPQISGKYIRSSYSDVLLEITPIEKSDDIHFIVGKVKERAHSILKRHLGYDDRVINGFIVALSEVCQNIIEHSETKGFVGIQKYHFQNIDKNIVKIAVMDTGIGFRKSLSERFPLKNDLEAIEKGLLHGASRYTDEGRGHGLAAVRRFVNQWNGKLSIRSGTAKLSLIPHWARGKEKELGLTYFPGAQINIMLPEV